MRSVKGINVSMVWVFLVSLCLSSVLFGAKLSVQTWQKGESFSQYVQRQGMEFAVDSGISEEDSKYLSEIQANQAFYVLKDTDESIEQVLVPIGEEMQIRLAKERRSGRFIFDIIPISYKEKEYSATVTIYSNPHTDIKKTLHYPALADKMSQLLKGTVNTRGLKKGDTLSFIYVQKTRMGKPYYMPHIKIAMLDSKGKKQLIYADEDGYGYTSSKKSQAYTVKGRKKVTYTRRVKVKGKKHRFIMPLRHARITSSFSRRRFHPILKRYRPHHGTDFGAKRGTPLLAVNAGRVIFSGYMGGYGKVVKIKHDGGYVSLYAHQSRIRVKRGSYVKKGQIIGHVGSTGRSTGPHLHFGLTKNGRWINPMKVLSRKSAKRTILKKMTKYEATSTTKYKTVNIKNAKENKTKLLEHIKTQGKPFIWHTLEQRSIRIDHVI
ncbi:MAG: M23 family metallopeptidase [Sulfurovum sp.]|nr:M23 family metallopeptidase [Sulfurovum sp.]